MGIFCLAVAFWPRLQADTAAPPPIFSTSVRVVNLFAVVHDTTGQIRNDLTKSNFELRVDGKLQSIAYFSQQTNLPLTLGVLVDTSASMLRVLDEERTAASKFLKQVLREHTDQAFLVGFDRNVRLLQGLTSSRRKLLSGLGVLDSQTWFERQMAERQYRQGHATRHQYSALRCGCPCIQQLPACTRWAESDCSAFRRCG